MCQNLTKTNSPGACTEYSENILKLGLPINDQLKCINDGFPVVLRIHIIDTDGQICRGKSFLILQTVTDYPSDIVLH